MATKSKNPLYVVTQDGKVVEEAKGQLDRFIKQFNLGPVIKMWEELLAFLLSQIKNYPTLVAVSKMIDEWVTLLEKVLKEWTPFLFFYRA